MSSREILAINLKYYRSLSNLSQENFADGIGSNLVYMNQMENVKRNPSLNMLDKLAEGITKLYKKLGVKYNKEITGAILITYNKDHITEFTRIDSKNKKKS